MSLWGGCRGRSQRGKRKEILEGWRAAGREARTVSDPEKNTHVFLEGGGYVLSGTGCRTGAHEPVGKRPQIMPSWELPVEVFEKKNKKKKH